MADQRQKNKNWNVSDQTWDGVKVAVLMDIRDELQVLTNIFRCYKFIQIPDKIDAIRRNTAKPKRKKKL